MNYEIIDKIWWSTMSEQIGAVLIKTLVGYKAYIGTAQSCISESMDAEIIAQNGGKVTYDQAKGIFKESFKIHKITKKIFIT